MSAVTSERARDLAGRLAGHLREEYRDRCRDRKQVDQLVDRWRRAVETLPPEDSRILLRTVRPLFGYGELSSGERQHRLVQVGRELARLSGRGEAPAPSPPAGQAAERPKAGVATLNLKAEVQYIKGVGPRLGALLGNLGVKTVGDLLRHYPRRWEDRRTLTAIAAVRHEAMETVRGVLGPMTEKKPRRGLTILQAPLTDSSGSLTLTWFNQKHLLKQLVPGRTYVAHGKVDRTFRVQMTSPEIEGEQGASMVTGRIVPVYPLTGKLPQNWLRRLQYSYVPTYAPLAPDPVPGWLQAEQGFPARPEAVVDYHWPLSWPDHERARRRLAFEELFLLQVQVGKRRQELQSEPRQHWYAERGELVDPFLGLMPFPPTGAQRRVFGEILEDLDRDSPMNRLLQGDVGSGKTVVAAFAAWVAVRNGYQAAVMAPTEILAEQHFKKLEELLGPAGVRVGRLQGSMSKKGKRKAYELLAGHELDLVVGTHALIQEGVEFANLGLVVVDEQHKFGVMQRTVLRQKGRNPDLLVMTATPIPRTLALTLYGDLEVSRLDEMPPGRQPIVSESVPFSQRQRVYEEIRREVRQGRQAYIICPLIEESENLEATAAVDEAEVLRKQVFPELSVGLLHGRMKAVEKDAVMERFRRGEHHVLISTTVIEVGVDVPNATVMLVQDANRFGLAQLHQLRGRVGRGEHASRCIFMGDATSQQTQRRLQAIARLSDGFEVAEEDLEIRGPGDFYGVRQAGFPELKVADLLRDTDLLDLARRSALRLLQEDPKMESQAHRVLREHFAQVEAKAAEMVH